jgi:hypothetical protein
VRTLVLSKGGKEHDLTALALYSMRKKKKKWAMRRLHKARNPENQMTPWRIFWNLKQVRAPLFCMIFMAP